MDGISDDDFSQWYDSLRSKKGNESLSEYEVAVLAWSEAIRRAKELIKKGD